jgi:tetratricopeptide (TPR) repeat protein
MGEHVSAEMLERFIRGALGRDEARQVVRHLLTECPTCQALAAGCGRELFELADGREVAAPVGAEERAYDAMIDGALATVTQRHLPRLEKERGILVRLLAAVEEKPTLSAAIGTVQRRTHGGWPEVEALLKLAADERFRDRGKMLELAMFANVAASGLDPGVYGPALVADLQARTLGELANAFRLNDEFDCAEDFLERAMKRCEEGSGDDLVLARILDISASLYMSQRLLDQALETLEQVERLYRRSGETHLASRALIKRGNACFFDDRPREAVAHVRRGLDDLDEVKDAQLANIARKNLLDFLLALGEYREAGRLLFESNLREVFAGEPVILLQLRWVEGKILAGRRRVAQAERALLDVREGFLARGEEYDAALVGLDLAGVWLELGKAREVEELAEEMFETFQDLGVHREALRAVRYFRAACREQVATAELARQVARFIRQVEWHPQRRFVG